MIQKNPERILGKELERADEGPNNCSTCKKHTAKNSKSKAPLRAETTVALE
jgi:hypothetical protein